MLVKILILAAKSLFATFKLFAAESLDSLLLGENARAADAEFLLQSFFPVLLGGEFGIEHAQEK